MWCCSRRYGGCAPICERRGKTCRKSFPSSPPNILGIQERGLPEVMANLLYSSAKGQAMTPQDYASCIDACAKCALTCHQCAAACLREDEVKPMARCILLDMDCAAICELAAAAMARDSENASTFCEQCAAICDACGAECARHGMAHCQACADACRACASACREMATAA